MTQTYPAVLPPAVKVTDGTALVGTTGTYAAGNVNSTPTFEPDVYTDKLVTHPAGEADRTAAVQQPRACNMPY
jgi:hypothetical protein